MKTQLICDTFTLVGLLGYNKDIMRQRKPKNPKEPQVSTPTFKTSMDRDSLEKMGGCQKYHQQEESSSEQFVLQQMVKPCHEEAFESVKAPNKSAPGMKADTALTKDEMNLILDLEEERTRMGDFQRFVPVSHSRQ